MRPRELARFWWTLDARVDRAAYLKHGFALAAVKYAGDAALVFAATGQLWTPFNYSDSLSTLLTTRLAAAPSWLMPALAVWMLPFLWAGVTLTVRRAVDAGWPAWCAVAFFIPYLNYLLIAALCLKGTSGEGSQTAVAPPVVSSFGRSAALAIAVGAAIGLAMVAAAVPFAQTYGLALLFLTPFMIGTITGFVLNRRYDADGFETIWVTLGTFAAAGLATFAMSLEGAICILMAMPLAVPVGLFGAQVGRMVARRGEADARPAMFALAALPLACLLEPAGGTGRILHEVNSSIDIDAAPQAVWTHVIAFAPIPEPTDVIFRLGIAYPRSARIDGAGAGATRYCVFSTGAFVEPITQWETNRRLAFDVAAAPAPLRELSIYPHVTPLHLDGFLDSRRGEFRLVDLGGGRTRLEGSTWYRIAMAPEGYWQLWSDALIHRIHDRVLRHIKAESER